MGFRSAINTLISTIRNVTPNYEADKPFICDEDENGVVQPLESMAGYRHRAFDIRVLGYPTDDGEAGFTTKRFRARLGLRLLYEAQLDRAWVERIMAEDTMLLVQALMNPNNYDAAVVSIPPPFEPTIGELMSNQPVPQRIGWLLVIPFDMVFLQTDPLGN
jgi:hypothetical protein